MKCMYLPVVVVVSAVIAVTITIAFPIVGVSYVIAVVAPVLVLVHLFPQLFSVILLDNGNLSLKSVLTEQ